MSKSRWWTPWTRWRRPAPAAIATPPARAGAAPGDAVAAVAPPLEAGAIEAAAAESAPERQLRFFCWMVGLAPSPAAGPSPCPVIGQMLEQLDIIAASESLRAGLLPRAPHVVPQLMKTLRDEQYSSVDVASRISKDAVLTAEVVRSASSVFEREDDGVEIDLARAVAMIGTLGLRRAIASV
ncbi:MAG TPA: HDOD domain-containing protein, partial [Caldimonas sp.]